MDHTIVVTTSERSYECEVFGSALIGKSSKNAVVIDDPSVSREHAFIEEENGSIYITDLNSTNGTFVNGMRITKKCKIEAKDQVTLGGASIHIKETGADLARTMKIQREDLKNLGYEPRLEVPPPLPPPAPTFSDPENERSIPPFLNGNGARATTPSESPPIPQPPNPPMTAANRAAGVSAPPAIPAPSAPPIPVPPKSHIKMYMASAVFFLVLIFGTAIVLKLAGKGSDDSALKKEALLGQAPAKIEVDETQPAQSKGEAIVDAEHTDAVIDSVRISFGPFNLDEPKSLKVATFPEQVIDDQLKINSFDISVDGQTQFEDYFTISLPYDDGFIQNGDAFSCIAAQHFNEATQEWQPVIYEIDSEKKLVHIETNHLSRYGVFTVVDEGLRHAYIKDVDIPNRYFDEDRDDLHLAVIKEYYSDGQTMGSKALSQGLNFWGKFSGHSGAAINLLTMGGIYSTKRITRLGNEFKSAGYAFAAIQLAYDLKRGDRKSAAVNLTKNLIYQAVSEINSASLNLAFVGVYFIDYSLTTFANAALASRYEHLFTVYDYYNKNYNPHRKSLKQWREFFLKAEKKYPDNPKAVSGLIESEIDAYAQSFLTEIGLGSGHENTEEFNSLAGEAGFKHIAWPNSRDIDGIFKQGRQKLIDHLYPVFASLNHYRINQMKETLIKKNQKIQREWNEVFTLTITEDLKEDEEPQFARHIVAIRPLEQGVDPRNWTGRLDENGYLKTSFTFLGHWLAGAPRTVEIFAPKADPFHDKPLFTKKFQVKKDDITVHLNEGLVLENGPWQISTYEAEELFGLNSAGELDLAVERSILEALDADASEMEDVERRQVETDKISEKKWKVAVRKLEEAYNESLSQGTIQAPQATYERYEKDDESSLDIRFLHQFHPKKRNGLYTFTIRDPDEEGESESKVLLDLKSSTYFEAKIFFKGDHYASIDYMKGTLKK